MLLFDGEGVFSRRVVMQLSPSQRMISLEKSIRYPLGDQVLLDHDLQVVAFDALGVAAGGGPVPG
jgi:hypothetical protein